MKKVTVYVKHVIVSHKYILRFNVTNSPNTMFTYGVTLTSLSIQLCECVEEPTLV